MISLGKDAVQVVVYPGGLPGAGWNEKDRTLLDGKIESGVVTLQAATGNRKYLAGPASEFAATDKFPPTGHQASYSGSLDSEGLSLKIADNQKLHLKRTIRHSPTLDAQAPAGAIIMFNGKSTDEWKGGRLDENTKLLNTDGKDIVSKRKFNNYIAHIEFMLPYRPEARGQGRGNSGFYQVQHYEVQILDSFGLQGKNNECGGVYTKLEPRLNMCLPPLTWQTYDIEFTNSVAGPDGKKIKPARLTLKHNGVVIHDDKEITGPTGGHRNEPEGTPGPILLQGHGNPLQFRNIWIVEK